jgi:hypothetical protein
MPAIDVVGDGLADRGCPTDLPCLTPASLRLLSVPVRAPADGALAGRDGVSRPLDQALPRRRAHGLRPEQRGALGELGGVRGLLQAVPERAEEVAADALEHAVLEAIEDAGRGLGAGLLHAADERLRQVGDRADQRAGAADQRVPPGGEQGAEERADGIQHVAQRPAEAVAHLRERAQEPRHQPVRVGQQPGVDGAAEAIEELADVGEPVAAIQPRTVWRPAPARRRTAARARPARRGARRTGAGRARRRSRRAAVVRSPPRCPGVADLLERGLPRADEPGILVQPGVELRPEVVEQRRKEHGGLARRTPRSRRRP